ncbi:Hypothetical protein SMAX5B_009158, partial [Scophthalmus maximus]
TSDLAGEHPVLSFADCRPPPLHAAAAAAHRGRYLSRSASRGHKDVSQQEGRPEPAVLAVATGGYCYSERYNMAAQTLQQQESGSPSLGVTPVTATTQ